MAPLRLSERAAQRHRALGLQTNFCRTCGVSIPTLLNQVPFFVRRKHLEMTKPAAYQTISGALRRTQPKGEDKYGKSTPSGAGHD